MDDSRYLTTIFHISFKGKKLTRLSISSLQVEFLNANILKTGLLKK